MADPTCSIESCTRAAFARGWCRTHYGRWNKTGDVQADKPIRGTVKQSCSVDGCTRNQRLRRGLCPGHYSRWIKHGDPGSTPIGPRGHHSKGEICGADGCGRLARSCGWCNAHYTRLRLTGSVRADVPVRASDRSGVPKACAVDGCDQGGELTRGWCAAHYSRWRKAGDVQADVPIRQGTGAAHCSAPDCTAIPKRRDWCHKHYQRVMKYGTTELPVRPTECKASECREPRERGDYCNVHYLRWYRLGDPLAPVRDRNPNPPMTCTVAGCRAPHYAKGCCRRHDLQTRYRENRQAILARSREHYRANREQSFAAAARRRQRVRSGLDALDRELSTAYRKAIAADRCFYCGAPGEHVDHYFPLAKGGMDLWWNLRRACAACNLSKFSRCGTWFRLREGIWGTTRAPVSAGGADGAAGPGGYEQPALDFAVGVGG